jgi:hypothetical protein
MINMSAQANYEPDTADLEVPAMDGPWEENDCPTKVFMYQELVQETSATLQIH